MESEIGMQDDYVEDGRKRQFPFVISHWSCNTQRRKDAKKSRK
jgi:hypothetical protein